MREVMFVCTSFLFGGMKLLTSFIFLDVIFLLGSEFVPEFSIDLVLWIVLFFFLLISYVFHLWLLRLLLDTLV